jgi:hypothetical protein
MSYSIKNVPIPSAFTEGGSGNLLANSVTLYINITPSESRNIYKFFIVFVGLTSTNNGGDSNPMSYNFSMNTINSPQTPTGQFNGNINGFTRNETNLPRTNDNAMTFITTTSATWVAQQYVEGGGSSAEGNIRANNLTFDLTLILTEPTEVSWKITGANNMTSSYKLYYTKIG